MNTKAASSEWIPPKSVWVEHVAGMAQGNFEAELLNGQSQSTNSSSMLQSSDLLEFFHLDAEFFPKASQYGDTHERLEIPVTSPLTRRKSSEKKWRRVRLLGSGAASTVWLETCQDSESSQRAVKEISKRPGTYLRSNIDYGNEVRALCQVAKYKESFVHILGWFESPDKLFLCLEYLPLGDLEHAMSNPMEEQEVRVIARQVTEGLKILHRHNWVHRDLKPENIYVERARPNWKVKIGDFNVSKRNNSEIDDRMTTQVGTLNFAAPEMIPGVLQSSTDEVSYTSAVDLWSLGATIYSLHVGRVPFPSIPDLRNYCRSIMHLPSEPMLDKGLSELGLAFVESLLEPDPKKRPSALGALDHPWFENLVVNQENFHSPMTDSSNVSGLRQISKTEAQGSENDSFQNIEKDTNRTLNRPQNGISSIEAVKVQSLDSRNIQGPDDNGSGGPSLHPNEATSRKDTRDLKTDDRKQGNPVRDGSTQDDSASKKDPDHGQVKPRSFKPQRQGIDSLDWAKSTRTRHDKIPGQKKAQTKQPTVTITGPHQRSAAATYYIYDSHSKTPATAARSTETTYRYTPATASEPTENIRRPSIATARSTGKTNKSSSKRASVLSKASTQVEPEFRDLKTRKRTPYSLTPTPRKPRAIAASEAVDSEVEVDTERETSPERTGKTGSSAKRPSNTNWTSQTQRQDSQRYPLPYDTTNSGYPNYPLNDYYGMPYQYPQHNPYLRPPPRAPPSFPPPTMGYSQQRGYYQPSMPHPPSGEIPTQPSRQMPFSYTPVPRMHTIPSPENIGETDNGERSKLEELKALFLADRQEREAQVAALLRKQEESYLALLKEKAAEGGVSAEANAAAEAAMKAKRSQEEIVEKARVEAWQQGKLAGIKETQHATAGLGGVFMQQPHATSAKDHDDHKLVILRDESGRSVLLPYLKCRTWFVSLNLMLVSEYFKSWRKSDLIGSFSYPSHSYLNIPN